MCHAVRQPDQFQGELGTLASFAARKMGEHQRQFHILHRREHRHQVVELEDKSDMGAAPVCEIGFTQLRNIDTADLQGAGIRLVDAGDQIQ